MPYSSEINVNSKNGKRRIQMRYLKYALWPTVFLTPAIAYAQNIPLAAENQDGSVGIFGGVGLLEMRNARFAGDGNLSVGAAYLDDGQNYYATWQATPWLETTLRFSDYDNVDGGVDKGLDVKVRLLEEGTYKPAIALGLQDMLGDGVFSGEYVVASKRIHDFDITMGFGFGQLANRAKLYNITRIFSGSFSERSFDSPGSEKLRFGNYFSGEKMGFFWGVEYKTPIEGMTAKLEYSTVDKSTINLFQDYESKTAFNFGINYKIKNWLEIGAGFMHGNQLALHLTVKQSLHKPMRLGFAKAPAVDEIRSRELRNNAVNNTDYKNRYSQDIIFERLQQMGYMVSAVNLNGEHIEIDLIPNERPAQSHRAILGAVLENYRTATVSFQNNVITASLDDDSGKSARALYRRTPFYTRELNFDEIDKTIISKEIFERLDDRKLSPLAVEISENEVTVTKKVAPFIDIPKNIGRTARLLTIEAPDTVERFTIISKERNLNVSKVSVLRKDFEKIADYNSSPEEILANAVIENPVGDKQKGERFDTFPNFEYGILPELETHFGSDKNDHFKGDLNLKVFGRANISDDLQVYAEVKQHIIGNLDLIPVSNNPNVDHVRSDIGLYAAEGTTSLRRLSLEYLSSPADNIYTRLTAGHLEAMYSGVSGEILYRPYGSSISFGAELNFVKQRGYDQLFNMRDYETVTGHATLYHVNKKYDITSRISVGRYLAKDWGTTVDVSRQFNNGIRIGATATFTNMSESDFGRGNFDKGIYMTIPFDFFWFKQSREKASFKFKRLGKNGGQKLDHNTDLFDVMSASQPYKLRNGWNRILE